jgi:hypothetical protein
MTKKVIALDGAKVRHCINVSGIPRKRLLDNRLKLLQRILRGENTTMPVAMQLASELKMTVDDLCAPITKQDIERSLPENWLYEEGPNEDGLSRHIPFFSLIGGSSACVMAAGPTSANNTLEKIFNERLSRSRKMTLRRADHAYLLEIKYFHYGVDRRICYEGFKTSVRFFPLKRNGDSWSKTSLNERLQFFVWNWLCDLLANNAEMLDIEGETFPDDPDAYHPLVRFHQGPLNERKKMGARLFSQIHRDFRVSLIDYLSGIADRSRIKATMSGSGFLVTVKPLPPDVFQIGWRDNVDILQIDLIWRTADGTMQRAPWRSTDREGFVNAINEGRWSDCYSPSMPVGYVPDARVDDIDTPPMLSDPDISADDLAAIKQIPYYDPYSNLWEI